MVISFSNLGKRGRLGNQMFQVASTMGLAEKYGTQASFPPWEYEKYFETPIPHGPFATNMVKEKGFHHYDWEISGDADIWAYLQSEKYFGSTPLKLKDHFVEACKSKFQIWEKETICIQVRRGDYVGNPNYYQVPPTFYISALIEHFPNWEECNILFISDDIEYCRTHFECMPNAFFSTGNSDIQDMALGSCCDHFIISNSTFGWWTAWLGEKPHSKIVHSGHLFDGNLIGYDIGDYRPERWINMWRDRYNIPLHDMTFTIPVFYDHEDRKNNLDMSIFMLQSNFDTNIMVCEQGGDRFLYIEKFVKYAVMSLPYFHRTRMLNWMAEVAETQYVANWDCDVIIPPMQVYMAVFALRKGADMVYPYDGRFARMPRHPWLIKLSKALDIGVVRDEMFKNREKGHLSVGGAVFFNREAFIDGGMENEYMISFGPEDYERMYRFEKLGYRIERIRGSLFHLDHFVGLNSGQTNPFYHTNHQESNKVKDMPKPDLRAYVDTWPWRNQYTSNYYHRIQEGAILSAKYVMEVLGVEEWTVIDVGCGLGEWNNGNPNYFGVDHKVQKVDLLIPQERYIDFDLSKDVFKMDRKFDLCICLEVAEHLPESYARFLVMSLCGLSDQVLFSAAIPRQGGTGHVNEQWQTYWEAIFDEFGFGAAEVQPDIRNLDEVEMWYRQNIVHYVRGGSGTVQNFVLPEYYEQITKHLHGRLKDLGR